MIQQIPKIRIGNTINVGIAVMAGGQPRDLTGLDLRVVLVDSRGSKARIDGWTIEGEHNNVIRFTLQGFTQNNCGIYKVIVYENANKPNQAVVDSRLLELVRESAMEEGVDSGLIDKDVDLQIGGILIGGRDGTGIADFEQVQSSSVSLGENIWKISLTDGREYNIVVKNGEQGLPGTPGQDGHTPEKGVDYFTEDDIASMVAEVESELGESINSKYSKPSGGIPKTDLSSDVQTSLGKADTAIQRTEMGAANGVATLDSNGLVPSSQLPSFVDDVIEVYARTGQTALSQNWFATESASGTVVTPQSGKIYVLMADSGDYSANSQFRWGGSAYVKLNDGGVSAITNAEIDTITAS